MKNKVSIHWFRQDLRIQDNPSLSYLTKNYDNIVCVFILDEINCDRIIGSASKVWLYNALKDLNQQLNGNLIFLSGDPLKVLDKLTKFFDVEEISWNRCYEPWTINRDKKIKEYFKNKIKVNSFNGLLLWEPWEVLKDNGTPYKVFTPYYKRGCLSKPQPREPKETNLKIYDHNFVKTSLKDLKLLKNKEWEEKILKNWKISELDAKNTMESFFKNGVSDYTEGRNFPSKNNVSRLSPYIHWGQISVNTLWYNAIKTLTKMNSNNVEVFMSELGWREFAYYLLFHCPKLQTENLQNKFDSFPWNNDDRLYKAWINGKTGYPIIDAGMRELWQTGYMHNRVRMIVGSFLVKNLLNDWRRGEAWFWDCLLDASVASNSASWQWVAGTGTDSTPYFRIFNPITQSQKFDPDGIYIRKFIPEIKKLPNKYIFCPWETPNDLQQELSTIVGKDYPEPIVEIKESRELALNAFASIKK
jgi:deoxyribodipyrimidine photo-lyase